MTVVSNGIIVEKERMEESPVIERNRLYFYSHGVEEAKVAAYKQHAENVGFEIIQEPAQADVVASIGGDGQFLQAVRKTGFRQDCLYVGISTETELGFYCDFHLEFPEQIKEAVSVDTVEVRRYPVLEVSIDQELPFYCLNECSIKTSTIKAISIEVWVDDLLFETFKGDGLVISTPTGSTGYNKSINGAIIDPLLPCFQVGELASVNNRRYRTISSPFVVSSERTLYLKVEETENNFPIIGFDNEAFSVRFNHQLRINLSNKRIKTVKLKNNGFWNKVQRRFL